MTEYLKKYIAETEEKLKSSTTIHELGTLLDDHKQKILFMQHERLVHFLVTMMFAIILAIFIGIEILTQNILLSLLILIIIVLLCFYVKHYYFLENTVQYMYVLYDKITESLNELISENEHEKEGQTL